MTTDQPRPVPRRLKGFRDIGPVELRARWRMIEQIRAVYERYGFAPLETPALEYLDVLGKYLPDADTPQGGVFAFRDDEDEWIALRYDLTAPLSRYVAMNPELPLPFRRYQVGPVYRLEKPGPGRFREFYQCDFDTVGSDSMLADAEVCMVLCEALETLGLAPGGQFVIRVNNRKLLDGVIERIGAIAPVSESAALNVLRNIDKLDRVGVSGVRQLLGKGRRDESGDFAPGVGLNAEQISLVEEYLNVSCKTRSKFLSEAERLVSRSQAGDAGLNELQLIGEALSAAGFEDDYVIFDPKIVRGLEYYTGPVYEATLDLDGYVGSVAGGGRYDSLVERFTGKRLPATGASIGVDRLLAALRDLGLLKIDSTTSHVLVTQLDERYRDKYQKMAFELRAAGINAELYVGTHGIGRQFKYASATGRIVAVIMGEDEARRDEVSIKDLRLGEKLSQLIGEDRRKWLEQQPAQMTVPRSQLVEKIREVLARYQPQQESGERRT